MSIDTRPLAPVPFEGIDMPSFTLTSSTLTDGAPMPESATARAGSLSPDLAWEGFPENTASFLLTCFDPDAPIPSGWWHWAVLDIPASMTHLEAGAGASDLMLDGPAFHLRGDAGEASYFGAAPPAGTARTATSSRCTPWTQTPWVWTTTRPRPWPRSWRSTTRSRARP